MSHDLLRELARVNVLFQQRAIATVLGIPSTPAECGCVPGHRMTVLESRCADCGLTEQQVAESGNRPCSPRSRCSCSPEVIARVQAGGTCAGGGCPYGGDF